MSFHTSSFRLSLPSLPIMGVHIADCSASVAITALLATPGRKRVAFFNAHCGNVATQDLDYADALTTADAVLPDGIGVEMAARLAGLRVTENLNGTDFIPALLHEAATQGARVYLLGGQPGVAEDAAANLQAQIPGLQIAGTCDGYDGMRDEAATIAAINRSGADILLVALGVPLQDLWLARNAHRLTPRLTFGVGALLDFLSGRVRRAPALVRKMRGEWLWRLMMEPRRMAKRYLIGNATFLARAARSAVGKTDGLALLRRGVDLSVASAAVLMLWPIFAMVALAIRCDSPGPVFFRQTRIGRGGRHFTMLKFRSMTATAEAGRAAIEASSDRDGVCFKARQDPRVTRVGRLLRRFSVDELPQILNVLRGDMALVGPRPALPQEVAAYPRRAMDRLSVRPGLTGVWQVSGRADIGFDKMIDMDLAYVQSRSLWLDLLVLGLTARAVLSGRGAY